MVAWSAISLVPVPRSTTLKDCSSSPSRHWKSSTQVLQNGPLDFPSEYRGSLSAETGAVSHRITSASMISWLLGISMADVDYPLGGPDGSASRCGCSSWEVRKCFFQDWREKEGKVCVHARVFSPATWFGVFGPWPLWLEEWARQANWRLQHMLRMASFRDHYVGIHPTVSSPPAKLRLHIGSFMNICSG